MLRQRISDQIMQAHKVVRQVDRPEGCIRVAVYEAVGIRSRDGYDQRTPGKRIGKLVYRISAAPGVQRDHQISLLTRIGRCDLDRVAL